MSARKAFRGIGVIVLLFSIASGGAMAPARRDSVGNSAQDLQRSAGRFLNVLSRDRYSPTRLINAARSLERSAGELSRSARSGRHPQSLHRLFDRVSDDFQRVRRDLHRGLDFRSANTRNRWYFELMQSWTRTVGNYGELESHFGRQGGYGYGPDRYPIDYSGPKTVKVRCKSENYQPASCYVGGRIQSLTLKKQKSRAPCSRGVTYGFSGGYVWVKDGCDGEFEVTYRGDR